MKQLFTIILIIILVIASFATYQLLCIGIAQVLVFAMLTEKANKTFSDALYIIAAVLGVTAMLHIIYLVYVIALN